MPPRCHTLVVAALLLALAATRTHADEPTSQPTSAPTSAPTAAPAHASTTAAWSPVRIYVVCQDPGRTRGCPAFFRGFIDETPVLVFAPLAQAQVVLYYTATAHENDDHVLLRFTGAITGAPAELEVVLDVSTRGTDDEQRAVLGPAFLRGVAPFVGAAIPGAVTVTLAPPATATEATLPSSPWSFEIQGGGFGSVSGPYKQANFFGGVGVSRVTATDTLLLSGNGNYSLSRSPDLVAGDGTHTSLDTDGEAVGGELVASHNLGPHTAVGGALRGGGEDHFGRYSLTGRLHAGITRDWFRSDDPRGNQLELGYFLGVQGDRYNIPNELGEQHVAFATHGVTGTASVRKDKVTYNLSLSAFGQLQAKADTPRRFVLQASPSIDLQIGAHVDLSLSLNLTEQQAPGPDPAAVDPNNYQQVSRLQYAEPFAINAFVHLRFHWDRTDPHRNNRFSSGLGLGSLGTL